MKPPPTAHALPPASLLSAAAPPRSRRPFPPATKLSSEPQLRDAAFGRVLFTFPHSGVKGRIERNRLLLAGFFREAPAVLAQGGQVELTLARGQGGTPLDPPKAPGNTWQARARRRALAAAWRGAQAPL